MAFTGRFVLACLCVSLASISSVGAQSRATTADLSGVVFDRSQAALPGAVVAATHVATNLTRTAVTRDDGRFRIPALPTGAYVVTATAPGFAVSTVSDVTLTLGSVVELQFVLDVAGIAVAVDVTATRPLVDTQRTEVATVVSEVLIDGLPINGRNFIAFSLITPNVNVDRTPQQGASATSGLTFGGQRARSNNISVDGLDNNDSTVGGVRATFSQEAVQEFQVLAGSFAPEFGKASGGVVNIITKSGGNQHQGSVFYFFRDDALNSREYFERFSPSGTPINRPKAPYSHHQFGGAIGGPVRRDATFYFMAAERLDVTASNFITIDDSEPVSVLGQQVGTAVDVLRRAGFQVDTGYLPYVNAATTFLGKVDHRFRPGQDLSVRFNWADMLNENVEPWGGLVARSRGATLDSRDAMIAAGLTTIRSTRLLNELRVQGAYRDQNVYALDPSCSGICDRDDEGGPTLEISGVAQVGRQRFTPQPRDSVRYQVLDTVSAFQGNHNLKAGFDFSSVTATSSALPLHFGGRYVFTPLPAIPGVLPVPVSAVQALALGLPAAYVQGYGNPSASYTTRDLSLFVQDEWTPRPDVTVRGGVRFQRQFWPDRTYQLPQLSYSFPSAGNLAPRIAVAWKPRVYDGRTSIHASYGVFHDQQLASYYGVSEILTGDSDGVRTLVARFPGTLPAWNAPGRRLAEPATPYPSLEFLPSPNLRTPYAHHFNAGLNGDLRGQISLSANVMYERGHGLVGTLDYNPLVPALGAGVRPDDANNPATGVPIPGTSASLLQFTSFGETWYRGLTLSATRRDPGLQIQISYTLAKAEDNSTDFQSTSVPQNMGRGRDPSDPGGLPLGFDPDDERGPSVQDERHRLVASVVWSLPGSWQLSGIVAYGSGRPYNILAGTDLDGNGDAGNFPADRARREPADPSTSLRRNSGRLPAQSTVDLRVARRFQIHGRARIEGLFEVFNLLNRTNYTEINNVFGAGSYPSQPLSGYGLFQQAGPPRQVQLAARLTF
jgi:hypothetical protein